MVLVCVEGGIAAGKSTLINKWRQQYLDGQSDALIVFLEEPIDQWTNIAGHNLLQAFYDEPARWGFTFQIEVFLSRVKMVEELLATSNTETIFILERSWINDCQVFGYLLHQEGKMSEMEWQIYTKFHQWLINKAPQINHMLYLDTAPTECVRRKISRGRAEESGVPDDYIQRVAERYQEIITKDDQVISTDLNLPDLVRLVKGSTSSCVIH